MKKQHDVLKRGTDICLCQTKKTHLPYNLGGMVAQVLIVFAFNNGQKLFKGVLWVSAEKDGAFIGDGTLTHHQALPFPKTRRRRQLACINSLPDS